jgi:hypothetical protein
MIPKRLACIAQNPTPRVFKGGVSMRAEIEMDDLHLWAKEADVIARLGDARAALAQFRAVNEPLTQIARTVREIHIQVQAKIGFAVDEVHGT